jgi:hypothetical protein
MAYVNNVVWEYSIHPHPKVMIACHRQHDSLWLDRLICLGAQAL